MATQPREPGRLFPVLLLSLVWLVFLAYGLKNLLIPPVSALVLLFLLFPYRSQGWAWRTILVAVLLSTIWLLGKVSSIVWIAALGLMMAYLLNPPVAWLEKKGVPRSRGAVMVVLPAIALVTAAFVLGLPPLFNQALELASATPAFLTALYEKYSAEVQALPLERLPIDIPAITQRLTTAAESMISGAGHSLVDFAKHLGGTLSIILLTPVVGYRLLTDLPALRRGALKLLPRRLEPEVAGLLAEMDILVGRYLRGQMLVSLIVGTLTIVGLSLLGLPYAIVIGALAGALNMVPVVGYWISLILAIFVALSTPNPLGMSLGVAAIFFGIQIIEQTFVSPRVVGKQTGLNPVAVLLSLLVFAALGGIAGALLAIPFTLFLRLFFRRYVARRIREADFTG